LSAAPATAAWPLASRCDLLATALTFPAGAPEARESLLEAANARPESWRDQRLIAASTVRRRQGEDERSLFADGESCGDRLHLITPGSDIGAVASLAKLELQHHQDGSGLDFHLALERLDGQLVPGAPPALDGTVFQDERGAWQLAVAAKPLRSKRAIDPVPRESERAAAGLEPARVEAWLELETGGDVMGSSPREAGLVLVVHYERRELRQTLASCAEPALGTELGELTGDTLQLATCGDLYRLVAEPGVVRVDREQADGATVTVTRIPLPNPKLRALRPATPHAR
jgi:hypothetical protein